jgi:nicotinamide-nucleotide amidase
LCKNHGRGVLLQVNKDQALVPSKAKVLMNTIGTAPGMLLENRNKTFIALPGVPFEMKKLVKEQVVPALKAKYNCPFILHKTLLTQGIGESTIAKRIEAWEDALPSTIKLAYLPNLGSVRLRLSSKGFIEEEVKQEVAAQINTLLPLIEDVFVGFEDEVTSLELLIAKQLTQAKKTLAVAESCTGGALAEKFTQNAGASTYFKGGMVTYATETKVKILEVSEQIINTHSVVSAAVAEAMAKNVRQLLHADYGIATTGNAGPSKGEASADIGTVYIAVATKNTVISEKFTLGTDRKRVIKRAVNKALELLEKEILKK